MQDIQEKNERIIQMQESWMKEEKTTTWDLEIQLKGGRITRRWLDDDPTPAKLCRSEISC